MPKVLHDEAHAVFRRAEGVDLGTRVKEVRDRPLTPGGRVELTLFERVAGGRPHPRLRVRDLEVDDPAPPLPAPRWATPSSAADVRAAVQAELQARADHLALRDLGDFAGEPSPHYRRARIRVQRIARVFAAAREAVEGWASDGTLSRAAATDARYAIAQLEDETYATDLVYDDADTGTYHGYGEDHPFVHYLETLLASLPTEGSIAMESSMPGTREAIRRQRDQAQAHLDHLMRHKYAFDLPNETDIERTVGGFLVDRVTRQIASETLDADPLVPRYELLRIAPKADHPHAGAWVHRDGAGGLRLPDFAPVEVDPADLRASPREASELTFRRAPGDPHLRPGVRLDWDDSGWIDPEPIAWVSWAGHCDVKAVLEQLGITLTETPRPHVTEWRSDTDEVQEYDRDLLLEMIASVIELGSVYRLLDGTGYRQRGIHHFGGSRNDSLPDRLQFQGPAPGRSFRWPLDGRADAFVVTELRDADGTKADLDTAFFRWLPNARAVTFERNPRYLKTVEGDYAVIDVSGARLEVAVQLDAYDPRSGYPRHERGKVVLDLRPDAPQPPDGRWFLGTHIDDAAEHRLYRAYYEPKRNRIVAELERWEQDGDGRWYPVVLETERIVMPMVSPAKVTLSRELQRDDPAQFRDLLQLALREGRNICADTDKKAEVWNGVVTRVKATKTGDNREARTERWHVELDARFGRAELDYLMQREADGDPKIFVPAVGDDASAPWPDFLWREEPDVGSKGVEDGDWVVNDTMVERGLVTVRPDASVDSGFYVYDEHVKNVFELLYCGLAGTRYTIVHDNERWALPSKAAWDRARAGLRELRAGLTIVADD